MSKSGLWIIASIACATLLYLVYVAATFEAPAGRTTVVIPPPVREVVEEAAPPPTIRPSLPQIRLQTEEEEPPAPASEPIIEELPTEVAAVEVPESRVEDTLVELPSLNESDSYVVEKIREFQNGVELVQLLADEQILRKFVVFVENVSRGELPQTALPYRGISQEMSVSTIDENLFEMDASSYARFDQVVDTFVSIDTDAALLLYRSLSPLFQQAYAEIGFRNVNFDDTLRAAINNVLRASDAEGPLQLVKPSVMFLYADSSLENLDNVNKQLIRLGPENSDKLKAKLREFTLLL
jgi:hypothetical protein